MSMLASEFYDLVWDLKEEGSRNSKKEMIREVVDSNPKEEWRAAVLMIAGQEFENNGISTKSAKKAFIQGTNLNQEELDELYTQEGTLTEAIDLLVHEYEYDISDDSIVDIVENLEQVADMSGDAQITRLANVFATSHPMVVCFGVLPDDLSIGVTQKTIASAIAHEHNRESIERGRGLIPNSVEFVEYYQADGNTFPPSLVVGRPFLPMKAKNKDMPEDDEIDQWVAQMKVDGFRLLIHVDHGDVKAFTRNMDDVTHSLPELDEVPWPDGEFIFDCEAIAYEDGEPQGYRATSERIGRKHNIGTFTTDVHFECFDCLYANEDISEKPFSQRFEVLSDSLPLHDYTTVLDLIHDISEARLRADEENYEGVIVKDLESPYKFDKRSGFWRKLKLTDETVDLRVVDFEVGKGDDAGTLGRMRLETSDGTDMGWVGNGWTDEEQDEIWANKDEYKGEIAEISFEGIDQKPRFPVFENWRPHGEADSEERVKNIGGNY